MNATMTTNGDSAGAAVVDASAVTQAPTETKVEKPAKPAATRVTNPNALRPDKWRTQTADGSRVLNEKLRKPAIDTIAQLLTFESAERHAFLNAIRTAIDTAPDLKDAQFEIGGIRRDLGIK